MCFVGRSLDIALSNKQLDVVKGRVREYRQNVDTYHELWFKKCTELAADLKTTLTMPRRANLSTNRDHPADTIEEFYKRSFTIPMLGKLIISNDFSWRLREDYFHNIAEGFILVELTL